MPSPGWWLWLWSLCFWLCPLASVFISFESKQPSCSAHHLFLRLCFSAAQSRELAAKKDAELGKQAAEMKEKDTRLDKQAADLEKQAAELAWRKFLLPHYKVKVTLDPDMAHHMYVLSQDNSRVRLESERHQDPDTRKTFDDRCCVLGREEFREGRHCWLVEVEGEQIKDSVWAVGVIKASMERTKGTKFFGDKWAVQYSKGQLESLTYPSTPLSLSPVPTRIWICLDCTQEQVSFFNADNGVQIYTSAVSFNGESLRPWFWIRTLGIQLCLRDSTPQTPSPALGSSCPCPATPASPLLGPAGAAQK
nr:butyrophilin subfamily 1 member A1-like isoform X1 [Anas platyrhynchos]XP_038043826.1 butyrophilin subfamily 1 member A1-like isoform X1 [Anas platyrhynchos]XP_038043827.1 butyrophilin subfamily 1 member A1-like isoform X1 [Anas platyrhynchos]XP_038043828.1 butyrophilin subfamily 1 member A1-like isoform X1 [Anas platyrhynchos]XP_038043829.1 butyrophilin subfamily 1 member A1-like isoform X1 [Anas platyrhynchos]